MSLQITAAPPSITELVRSARDVEVVAPTDRVLPLAHIRPRFTARDGETDTNVLTFRDLCAFQAKPASAPLGAADDSTPDEVLLVADLILRIAERDRSSFPRQTGWYRLLESGSGLYVGLQGLLRKNPNLRLELQYMTRGNELMRSTLRDFTCREIGFAVAPPVTDVQIKQALRVLPKRISRSLTVALREVDSDLTAHAQLVKAPDPKVRGALINLGTQLVTEAADGLLEQVQEDNDLRAVLSAVLIEEPIVLAGYQEAAFKMGVPDEARKLLDVLGVRSNNIAHTFEATPVSVVDARSAFDNQSGELAMIGII